MYQAPSSIKSRVGRSLVLDTWVLDTTEARDWDESDRVIEQWLSGRESYKAEEQALFLVHIVEIYHLNDERWLDRRRKQEVGGGCPGGEEGTTTAVGPTDTETLMGRQHTINEPVQV